MNGRAYFMLETESISVLKQQYRNFDKMNWNYIFFCVDVLILLTGDICSVDVTNALECVLPCPWCYIDRPTSPRNAPPSPLCSQA